MNTVVIYSTRFLEQEDVAGQFLFQVSGTFPPTEIIELPLMTTSERSYPALADLRLSSRPNNHRRLRPSQRASAFTITLSAVQPTDTHTRID